MHHLGASAGRQLFEPGSTVNVEFAVSDEDGDVSGVKLKIGDGLVQQTLEARTGTPARPRCHTTCAWT